MKPHKLQTDPAINGVVDGPPRLIADEPLYVHINVTLSKHNTVEGIKSVIDSYSHPGKWKSFAQALFKRSEKINVCNDEDVNPMFRATIRDWNLIQIYVTRDKLNKAGSKGTVGGAGAAVEPEYTSYEPCGIAMCQYAPLTFPGAMNINMLCEKNASGCIDVLIQYIKQLAVVNSLHLRLLNQPYHIPRDLAYGFRFQDNLTPEARITKVPNLFDKDGNIDDDKLLPFMLKLTSRGYSLDARKPTKHLARDLLKAWQNGEVSVASLQRWQDDHGRHGFVMMLPRSLITMEAFSVPVLRPSPPLPVLVYYPIVNKSKETFKPAAVPPPTVGERTEELMFPQRVPAWPLTAERSGAAEKPAAGDDSDYETDLKRLRTGGGRRRSLRAKRRSYSRTRKSRSKSGPKRRRH